MPVHFFSLRVVNPRQEPKKKLLGRGLSTTRGPLELPLPVKPELPVPALELLPLEFQLPVPVPALPTLELLSIVPEEVDPEAVLIDFDILSEPLQIIATMRESRSNKDALVVAVATATTQKQQAFQQGAHFVFQRPLTVAELRRGSLNAYDASALCCQFEMKSETLQRDRGGDFQFF